MATRCASAGSGRGIFRGGCARWFPLVRVWHLLSQSEAGRFPFQWVPADAADGVVGGRGAGGSVMTELSTHRLASLPLLLWKTPPGLELILGQEGVPFETVKDAASASRSAAGRFVLFDSQAASGELDPAADRRAHVLIDVDELPARRAVRSVCRAGRSTRGARFVDVWRSHCFRAGLAVCEGLASPASDRAASRCSYRSGRRLDADFSVSVSLSIGIQLPGRSR